MNRRSQKPEVRSQNRIARWFGLLILLNSSVVALAADLTSLYAERSAIERVYYNHRLGEKPPFGQVLPPSTLENLVRQELNKEAVLKKVYGVEVTTAMLDTEVQRINATTRAPDTLAEIKTALGNHPARFANVFAKPILVERLLREKFDNDDALHAPQRRTVEMVRGQLLQVVAADVSRRTPDPAESERRLTSAATNGLIANLVAILKNSQAGSFTETIWQLAARPAETNAPAADEIEIQKRFGSNAQILSSPPRGGEELKYYFEDLPPELQRVLRVQLRQPGDVSAVIEMPSGFLLYLAKEKTVETLSVATLSIPKGSYEEWLNKQNKSKP